MLQLIAAAVCLLFLLAVGLLFLDAHIVDGALPNMCIFGREYYDEPFFISAVIS